MMIKLGRNQILLWFSFVFVCLIINTTTTSLAQSDPLYFDCNNPSNYTANSVYETNLNTTFSILPTTNNGFGFFHFSAGQGISRVNSYSLCRGDLNQDICLSCLNNAIGSIRQLCSYKIDVMAYYEYCFFAYTNSTLQDSDTDPRLYSYMSELQNTTNVEWFNKALTQLMYTLTAQASNGSPLKKFASGNTTGPNFTTIYALVQCTPDLSKVLCDGCLDNLTNQIPVVLNGKAGGTVFSHMCNIQYDIKLFFNESNDALVIPPTPHSTQPSQVISPRPRPGKKKNTIVIVTTTVIGVIIVASLYILIRSKKRQMKQTPLMSPKVTADPNARDELIDPRNQSFTFSDIERITDNFNTVIGKGGFGTVFYGYIENNQVAVKMLSESSAQGYKEFQAEVRLLMSIHHKNITSLVGYCNEGSQKGIIYEYMAKGNLGMHLFDGSLNVLSWKKRLEIAYDTAQGLEYIHNGCKPPIVHRDVKCSNILLNENFQAKLADFGLSRAFATESASHVSTVIRGTPGYLDPEYYETNRLTEKSDVYSFGIVLLELITGRKVISDDTNIVNWAKSMVAEGNIEKLIDPRLHGDYDINTAWKVVELALTCVDSKSYKRPTMNDVVTDIKSCVKDDKALHGAKHNDLNRHMSLSLESMQGPNLR